MAPKTEPKKWSKHGCDKGTLTVSGASPRLLAIFAPWIKSRCEVIGPYQEKTIAVYIPINSDTGLDQVHYTWAGAAVLEALCLVYPTVNFVLTDSDCIPTSLFEVAELVNLMIDWTSRAEAMQHHTMASSSQCPPAVLLMTESKSRAQCRVDHYHRPHCHPARRYRHGHGNSRCEHASSKRCSLRCV